MKIFKKLVTLIGLDAGNVRQIYLLSALQGVFYLMVPLAIQAIVTYTMAGQFSASLMLLAILTITAVLFIGLFQLWQMRISETVQQNLLVNVGLRFAQKIRVLHPDLVKNGYIPSKINQFFDVLTLQKGLSKILLDVSFSIMSIVFGLLILCGYHSVFLIFTCVISIAFYFIISIYGKRAMDSSLEESKKKYAFVDWLHELFRELKHHPGEMPDTQVILKTDESLHTYIKEKKVFFQILDVQYRSILIFKVLFTAILLFTGIWLVQSGYLNIGQFVAAEILVILVINAVEKLVVSLKTVYDVLTATEKLFQVFHLQEGDSQPELNKSFQQLTESYQSKIYVHNYTHRIKQLIYAVVLAVVIVMFLPWTQTISAEGRISTLSPSERPQTLPSRISGRIERWFVKEGDYVQKGDTVAYISEIKEDYFDPKLIERTEYQLKSKESSIASYESKINAIDVQIDAINKSLYLKTQQARNKVEQNKAKLIADSAEFAASVNNYKINEDQVARFEELLGKGIISKTDYENRKAKLQESLAKKVSAENKWYNAKTDLLNSQIELNSIKQEYSEKLMKSESDKFSTLSSLYDAEAGLSKMQNQLSNYSIRNGFYYVTVPQEGYITKSFTQGVGEIVKDGSPLVSIVPKKNTLSVEFYIEPMDVPLVAKGMDVQLTFDGWPAFVFSGWPGVSFGTYHARIVAIDKVISDNGKYRVLAAKGKEEWPAALQVGGGVKALGMLKNVPVVYEIWRKINGFPPEFYVRQNPAEKEKKDEKK